MSELYFGRRITAPNDRLDSIPEERLVRAIKAPKDQIRDQIVQLRTLKSFDLARYRQEKVQLPYFVCACFHPAIRKREHFVFTEYFIIDLDHLSEAGRNLYEVKEQLCALPFARLVFISPGADGLKMVCRLSAPCKDASLFKSFYILFSKELASRLNLEEIVDMRTHDVSRACFISYDPDLYFQPDADLIRLEDYVSEADFFRAEKQILAHEKDIKPQPSKDKGPDAAALDRIRERLNPGAIKRTKEYFVPDEVNSLLEQINPDLEEYDIVLAETSPIQFGRKLKVRLKGHMSWAELNLFYGKKGFTVVPTTKIGSDPELAKLSRDVFELIISRKMML